MDVSELLKKRFLIAGKVFSVQKYDEKTNRIYLIGDQSPPLNWDILEFQEYIRKGIVEIIEEVEGVVPPRDVPKLSEYEFNLLMRRAKQREKRINELLEKVDYTLDKINECIENGWTRQKKRYEERLQKLQQELMELEYYPHKER